MKRYFLGLALALLAIPGVSRADVVSVVSVTSGTFTDKALPASNTLLSTLTFSNVSSPSNQLQDFSLLINTAGLTGPSSLTLKFQLNGGTERLFTDSTIVHGENVALFSLTGFASDFVANGGSNTLTVRYGSSTLDGTLLYTTTNAPTSATGTWATGFTQTGGDSNGSLAFDLTATVPEPATMILTGSVLAVGFGASVVRRLRKKSENQTVV